ncbi:MAG: DUF1080 domain-containing protein [Ferruginibacter sp.]|nr:DUF1080 domain-containing protein [Chitinophagaceae bacterium]
MPNLKKIILALPVLVYSAVSTRAQNVHPPLEEQLVFSAIKGTVSKTGSVQFAGAVKSVALSTGDTASFKILSYNKGKMILAFTPSPDFIGITKAGVVAKSATGKLVTAVQLTGLSTNGLEGRNEAPLSQVADALGYTINIGWTTLDNNSLPGLQGEEIAASLFKKAGKGKVEIIPVARYSPDFELPFGYYHNIAGVPVKYQVGVLAKAGAHPEHQCLFPAISGGSKSFDPGDKPFGFYATSPSHSAFSEDVWNMFHFPDHAVHATRIYPLKDKAGKQVANSYLLCMEEAKNGDYNDYVFIVKNITPVTKDPFTRLFNEKNLDGWNTFLRNIGQNKDPNNNFRIEKGELFVSGKDLGYMITKEGYSNFHFKVDFKWGVKKWPPRENAKRDAGICYNIPVNEPDSIWPQSIECQVQEGDTGDFWLLGFSTIKVDGVQNVPANHTRMIKQKDNEKPYGEWNTVEVISYNGKCVHIVNGVIVNVGEEASVRSGKILLQSEYAEIYYRNVKIREL